MRSDPIPSVAVLVCTFAALLLWNLSPPPRHIPVDPGDRMPAEAVPGSPLPSSRPEASLEAEDLARFFRRPSEKHAPPPAPVPPADRPPLPLSDRFKVLGTVTGQDGAARLYLKDLQGGTLIRIRLDGAEENGASMLETAEDRCVIRIGGEKFAVPRSRP